MNMILYDLHTHACGTYMLSPRTVLSLLGEIFLEKGLRRFLNLQLRQLALGEHDLLGQSQHHLPLLDSLSVRSRQRVHMPQHPLCVEQHFVAFA